MVDVGDQTTAQLLFYNNLKNGDDVVDVGDQTSAQLLF